jgi:DNA-binding CsgD family transcriptional regulator
VRAAPLERDHELLRFDEALDRARTGQGAVLIVAGPPGAGKTTLLAAATLTAEARGLDVLSARGTPLEADLGFAAVRQLFTPALRRRRAAERELLLDGAAGLGRAALGLSGAEEAQSAGDSSEAVFAAGHGLYWLTAGLAEQAPLLLRVDDAQWVDLASLRVLAYLARRLEDLPVALAIAHRADLDEPRAELLREIAGEPLAQVCVPAPLSERATATLLTERLGGAPAPAFVTACHRASGGNPFLLGELLAAATRAGLRGGADQVAALDALRAESVEQAVGARLALLPADAVRLAEAVAVLGDGGDTVLAAALAQLPVSRAATLADLLAGADLVSASRPLEFAHPLVARAVYTALPRGRRGLLHARAARLLERAQAPVGQVATHLLHTDPSGEPGDVRVLRAAAAESGRQGAPQLAAALLERALREPVAGPDRLKLTIELGEARLASGSAAGLADLERALSSAREERERAALALRIGIARYERGDVAGARAAIAEGSALIADRPDDDLLVSLQAADLICARTAGGPRALLTERLQALIELQGPGRTSLERLLLAQVAFEATQAGRGPHGSVAALALRALPPGDGELDAHDALALPLACMSLYFSDEFEPVERVLGERIRYCRARGLPLSAATASFFRGPARLMAGRLLGAIDDWETVLLAVEEHGWAFALPSLRALRALAALEQAQPALADQLLELPGGDERWREHPTFPYVLAIRGHVLDRIGRPEQGMELLLAAGARQIELSSPNPSLLPWRSRAGLCALRAGDRERAAALTEEELSLARRFGAPRAIGEALRGAGLVHGGPEGIELLREGVDCLRTAGAELELARTLVELGGALRRAGHRAEARDPLREGLDLADRCGGADVALRAAEELRTAGARPRRRRTSGAEALTAGERRVALLAAAGATNRQIAQSLFISTNTVARHLTHAYDKLGIEGRDGLAEALGAPPAEAVSTV